MTLQEIISQLQERLASQDKTLESRSREEAILKHLLAYQRLRRQISVEVENDL